MANRIIHPKVYFREMSRFFAGETYFDGETLRDKQTKLPVKMYD